MMNTLNLLFEQAATDYETHAEAILSATRTAAYLTADITFGSGADSNLFTGKQLVYRPETVHRIPGSPFSFGSYVYAPATFSGFLRNGNEGDYKHFVIASLFVPNGIRPVTTDTVSIEEFNSLLSTSLTFGSFTPEFRERSLPGGSCTGPCYFHSGPYSGPRVDVCIQSLTLSQPF